ncbi:MAG TPA: hypothetical protein VET23_03760 [Chitinophagaceae bacterium]|nr:hypothetical protein [Chitinophagaceae bacterium]
MNSSFDQLAKAVIKKDSLKDCSLQELQQLAGQYPYFGAVQLLLLGKLKEANAADFKEQLKNGSIFFQNPMWLHHLLNEAEKKETESLKPEEENNSEAGEITEEDFTEKPNLKIQIPETASSPLIFEPYHTVDYFASQGIKFKPDEKPHDKFGRQLKSFTEWLKALKKLPQTEIAQAADNNAEQKIEQLAEHSIKDREVLTESMAEVWEKQGNLSKAIEIYNKLSLLDPSKNAYFAAKIEQLKKTS